MSFSDAPRYSLDSLQLGHTSWTPGEMPTRSGCYLQWERRRRRYHQVSNGRLLVFLQTLSPLSTPSEDMKSLVHLKYCIKESLRLFPPVCVVGRVFDQDTTITGYTMPKGTSVVCHMYALHRHPDFWENPEVSTANYSTGLCNLPGHAS